VLAVDNVVLDGRTLKAHTDSSVKSHGDDAVGHECDDAEEHDREGQVPQVDTNVTISSISTTHNVDEAARASANPFVAQVRGSQAAPARGMHDRAANRWEVGQPSHWQSSACACGVVGHPVAGLSNAGCGAATGPMQLACLPQDVPSSDGDMAHAQARHAIDASSPLVNTQCDSLGARAGGVGMLTSHDTPAMLNPRGSSVEPDNCGAVSELEPWSGLGSFEDLLNGLVSEEEEESILPGSSRFARFFASSSLDEASCANHGSNSSSDTSTLASVGGHRLDAQLPALDAEGGRVCAKATSDEWQKQGFRALLPNVNISFTPFGATPLAASDIASSAVGDAATNGGRAVGTVGTPAKSLPVGSGGGYHGLSGFSNLGATATVGGPTRAVLATASSGTSSAPPMPAGVHSGSSCSGVTVGSLAGAFDIAGGLSTSVTSTAANCTSASLAGIGAGEISKNAMAPSSVPSLLHQLSASSIPLPATQLPACGLSSSLQSLLQSSNGAGCGNPIVGGSSSGVVGRGSSTGGGERVHNPSSTTGVRWHGGSRGSDSAGSLIPGWLVGDSQQPKGTIDDASGERVDVVGQKDLASNGPSRSCGSSGGSERGGADRGGADRSSATKKEGGSSDRGGKGKKRGGANNRGKGGSGGDSAKPTHK